MSKLIEKNVLPADFLDGQILYGEDLNRIIRILRESSNVTWMMLQAVVGSSSRMTYAESIESLNNIIGVFGDFGVVVNITRDESQSIEQVESIDLYKYDGVFWNFIDIISMGKIIEDMKMVKDSLGALDYSRIIIAQDEAPLSPKDNLFWIDTEGEVVQSFNSGLFVDTSGDSTQFIDPLQDEIIIDTSGDITEFSINDPLYDLNGNFIG